MTRRLWKQDSNTETAFGEVLRFPLWAFSERSRINRLQAQSLAFPLSGVSLRGLSLYELFQLWQIVIFVAFGGNVASLKFKSILPRWHWQRVQTLLKETVWTKNPLQPCQAERAARERAKMLRTETETTNQARTRAFMKIFHSMDWKVLQNRLILYSREK